jgi:hypothetical protein
VKKWIALFLLSIFSVVSTPRELWHHCVVHGNITHCDNQSSDTGFIDSPECEICNFQFQEFLPGNISEKAIAEIFFFVDFDKNLDNHNVLWGDVIALRGPPELS